MVRRWDNFERNIGFIFDEQEKDQNTRGNGINFLGVLVFNIVVLDLDDRISKLKQVFKQVRLNTKNTSPLTKTCDIFKTTYGKKAVGLMIERDEKECLKEILCEEKNCHKYSRQAISCFRGAIMTDERSGDVIKMLDDMYEKTKTQKYIIPVLHSLVLLPKLLSVIFDATSDVSLAIDYHHLSKDNNDPFPYPFRECFQQNISVTACDDVANKAATLNTKGDYQVAKYYTIISVLMMLLLNGPMTGKKLLNLRRDLQQTTKINFCDRFFVTFLCFYVVGPFLVILVTKK